MSKVHHPKICSLWSESAQNGALDKYRGTAFYKEGLKAMKSICYSAEGAEFQHVNYAPRTDNPVPDTTVPVAAEKASRDPRYAVMTPIGVGDHWTWGTWMCFDTFAQAVAHARKGNKVVRFQSPEWAALKQQEWVAPPQQIEAAPQPRETQISRIEGETFFEFVLRILDAYGLDQHAEPISEVK